MDKEVLRTRVLTGIVFAVLVVGSILSGKIMSTILLTVIGLGCTWEYLRLVKSENPNIRRFGILIFLLILCIFTFVSNLNFLVQNGLLLNCIIFAGAIVHLFYRIFYHNKGYFIIALFYTILPIVLTIWVLNNIADHSRFLLYILLLIWVYDSSAYFVGSLWGKHKLIEKVSPNKTWEGFVGGGILTILSILLLNYFFPEIQLYKGFILAIVVWIIGTFGDLFESSIKREANVKDSGNILPGHGGFLDRFDSLLFVLPFALYILFYM